MQVKHPEILVGHQKRRLLELHNELHWKRANTLNWWLRLLKLEQKNSQHCSCCSLVGCKLGIQNAFVTLGILSFSTHSLYSHSLLHEFCCLLWYDASAWLVWAFDKYVTDKSIQIWWCYPLMGVTHYWEIWLLFLKQTSRWCSKISCIRIEWCISSLFLFICFYLFGFAFVVYRMAITHISSLNKTINKDGRTEYPAICGILSLNSY